MLTKNSFALYGKNGIIIFEPSNGGNGIKLNTPNPIFIEIVVLINNTITTPTVDVIKDKLANLYIAQYINVNIIANIKFINGPANDTIASPFSIEIFLV